MNVICRSNQIMLFHALSNAPRLLIVHWNSFNFALVFGRHFSWSWRKMSLWNVITFLHSKYPYVILHNIFSQALITQWECITFTSWWSFIHKINPKLHCIQWHNSVRFVTFSLHVHLMFSISYSNPATMNIDFQCQEGQEIYKRPALWIQV